MKSACGSILHLPLIPTAFIGCRYFCPNWTTKPEYMTYIYLMVLGGFLDVQLLNAIQPRFQKYWNEVWYVIKTKFDDLQIMFPCKCLIESRKTTTYSIWKLWNLFYGKYNSTWCCQFPNVYRVLKDEGMKHRGKHASPQNFWNMVLALNSNCSV